MTEPSVEEIVAIAENNIFDLTQAHIRILIADWRKRGEALEEMIRRVDEHYVVGSRGHYIAQPARAALTPQHKPWAT